MIYGRNGGSVTA